MTEKQQKIFDGLNAIRPEVAQFYLDGLFLLNSDLRSKSYLIGHLLREIDSGLRDVFEQKKRKEEFQKNLSPVEVAKLFEELKDGYKEYEYLKDVTSKEFSNVKGHISSILVSFGLSFNSDLAKQYIKLAIFFHKYAHRSGSYSQPRSSNDIEKIWVEFDEILFVLIGNYYAIAERIDDLINIESPTPEILNALPNLLKDDSRNVYFLSNLKFLGWLRSLFENDYFDGKLNPEPIPKDDDPNLVSVPYWPILNYLEHVSQVNAQNPNDEISALLVQIINNIVSYLKPDGCRIENFRTDYSVFKILCNLPDNCIIDSHLDFIELTFESKLEGLIGYDFGQLLDRLLLLESKVLLLKSIDILLKFKIDESKPFDKLSSIFRDYDLGRIISEYKEKLISVLGNEILDLSIKKIKEVIDNHISSFDVLTIQTIEEHPQTMSPEKYECQLVYLVRDCFEKLPAENIREKLIRLLNEEQPIFKRIALHSIRLRYSEFNDIFWNWNDNPLAIPLIKHELYELLKQNAKEFDDKKIELILNWVDSTQDYTAENFKGDIEQMNSANAYVKKEWVTSLLDSGNELVSRKFEELDVINNSVVEHPGFDAWFSSSWGYISPLSKEEVERMSIEELIVFTKDYIKKKHDFMGDSEEGLSFIITSAVTNNFQKYISDCNALIEAPYIVLYAWMNGLDHVLNNEHEIAPLTEVLSIANEIVSRQEFWEVYNGKDRYPNWFISSMLRFVKSVLKKDSVNLVEADMGLMKIILFNIHKKDNSEVHDFHDLPMTVLNSSKGRFYTSLFEFSLMKARIEQKEEDRWDTEIKKLITSEISSEDEDKLLFCVLGQYLSNIIYLDVSWLKQNYSVLFSRVNPVNWHAIMTGYLFFHNRPNTELFGLLCVSDYELAIIESDKFQKEAITNLVNQLCGAYLNELDGFNIENPIMKALISSNNKSIISSYTYFFWSPKYTIPDKYNEKIKAFWKYIFDQSKEFKDPETDELRLSGSCKWLKNFNEIDADLYQWLIFIAPHINQGDKYFVFEYLEKHINKSPEKVGNILVEIFNHGIEYDISRGKISAMIQVLYDNGFRELADKICNMHGEKGIHYLRELFERNKK